VTDSDRKYDFDTDQLDAAKKLIDQASTIVILAPDSQDGDSVSTNLALKITLEAQGKTVIWVGDNGRDQNYDFLEQNQTCQTPDVVDDQKHNIDLVIVTDSGGIQMFKRALEGRKWLVHEKPTIIFDHHVERDDFEFTASVISATAAATGELMYYVYQVLGWEITPEIARLLMVGIFSDTNNFQNLNTDEAVLRVAAELTHLGAEPGKLSEEMARAYAPDPVGFRLIHEILSGAVFEDGVAYALVPYAQYKQAPTGTSIRHDVGQAIRYIQGVRVSFVILEKDGGEKYLSIRCHDGYDVAQIAAQFGGGGHKVAAGGNLSKFDSLKAAAEAVLKLAKAEANKSIPDQTRAD